MRIYNYFFSKNASAAQPRLLGYARHCFRALDGETHFHPYSEILFVLDGAGVFTQDGVEVPLHRGNLVVINPYTPHIERSASETDALDCVFFPIADFMFCAPQPNQSRLDKMENVNQLPAASSEVFLYDFSDCLQIFIDAVRVFESELTDRPPHFETYLSNLFNNLLILILRKTALAEAPQEVENTKSVQVPVAVARYLENYYTLDISLDALAGLFYVNKFYLAHAFKKAYGISPMQYLSGVRVREAMNLLKTSDRSVTAVAGLTGFVNASHFAKVFKRYTGQTPSDVVKARYKKESKP